MDSKKIKDWIEKRIDFWEHFLKNHPYGFVNHEDEKECLGMLKAFKMVVEFIEGQRR